MRSINPGPSDTSTTSFGKLILTGLAAGFAATAAKTLCEVVSPPRPPGVPSPLGNAIDAVAMGATGHLLPEATKTLAEPVVHFLFGMAAGGAYGVLAAKVPLARAGYGALYGISFWLGAHEIVLPLINLSPTPAQMTLWEQGNEFVSHIAFGVTLEFARRFGMRKLA